MIETASLSAGSIKDYVEYMNRQRKAVMRNGNEIVIIQREIELIKKHTKCTDEDMITAAICDSNGNIIEAILALLHEPMPLEVKPAPASAAEARRAAKLTPQDITQFAEEYTEEYKQRMKAVAEASKKKKERELMEKAPPFIGFSLEEKEEGLVVTKVVSHGPAWQVGIRPGFVIEGLFESNVNDIASFREAVEQQCNVGKFTTLRVINNDKQKETKELWIMTADESLKGRPVFFDRNAADGN